MRKLICIVYSNGLEEKAKILCRSIFERDENVISPQMFLKNINLELSDFDEYIKNVIPCCDELLLLNSSDNDQEFKSIQDYANLLSIPVVKHVSIL